MAERKRHAWLDELPGFWPVLLAVVVILSRLAFWGAAIFVAVHFIRKFW